MKFILGLLSIFTVLSLTSCNFDKAKPSTTAEKAETPKVPQDYVMLNQEELSGDEIKTMRSNALSILNHRQKESNNKAYSIIVNNLWKYDGAVKNSDFLKGDQLAGKWIAFKDDLTYEYGDYQETKGSGRYFFDLEKNLMLMLDNHPDIKPQEFEVKLVTDMMVLVGNYIYQDNNLQAKLVSITSKPTKQ